MRQDEYLVDVDRDERPCTDCHATMHETDDETSHRFECPNCHRDEHGEFHYPDVYEPRTSDEWRLPKKDERDHYRVSNRPKQVGGFETAWPSEHTRREDSLLS